MTLDALRAGRVDASEMRATASTLRMQADVARAAGGRSSPRASSARLSSAVPDELLLDVYTALRPGRATAAALEEWATASSGATATAAFGREAAAAYGERGLLADA